MIRIGFAFLLFANASLFAGQTTTTALQSSLNPARMGQQVTLTAMVTPPAATGKVTFYDGATVLGISGITAGKATFTTTFLAVSHALKARYDGDAGNNASNSAVLAEVVNAIPVSTFIALPGVSGAPQTGISADLNGDGIPDLITLQQYASTLSIFLGNGDGTFTAGPTYPLYVNLLASGDFNGDGKVDLALAIGQGQGISILLGNGDGTFQSPVVINLPVTDTPGGFGVADFNGDGYTDLVVSLGQSLYVLPGIGDGTFGAPRATSVPVDQINQGLGIGDFNGDGKVDLIGNSTFGFPFFYAGNGDGTFQAGVSIPGVSATQIAVADLNGDGKLDAVFGGPDITVLLGNGDGTFRETSFEALNASLGVFVTDVNGDGKPDLVTSRNVLLGFGDGTFQAPIVVGDQNASGLIAVADLNNNGQIDLVESSYSAELEVFLGTSTTTTSLSLSPNPASVGQIVTVSAVVTPPTATGTVSFFERGALVSSAALSSGSASITVTAGGSGEIAFSASYSGDGANQPSASGPVTETVTGTPSTTVLAASTATATFGQSITLTATVSPSGTQGKVTFVDGGTVQGIRSIGGSTASMSTVSLGTGVHHLTAEYDGGGTVSVSVSGMVSVTVSSLGAGTFTTGTTAPTGLNPGGVFVADLNGDGLSDVITANQDNTISILLATGSDLFSAPVNYSIGAQAEQVSIADLNGDGSLDLSIATQNGIIILLGNGDGTFRGGTNLTFPLNSVVSIAAGDLNGDGVVDLVTTNTITSAVLFLAGNGDGTFEPAVSIATGATPFGVAIGDFNSDGRPDVAFFTYGGLYILPGNGDGTFQAARITTLSFTPGGIALGDLNQDGKLDAVITGNYNDVVVLLGQGDGTFQSAILIPVTGSQNAVIADFNGDGHPDILIKSYSSGFSLIFGNGDGTFQQPAYFQNNGAALAIGDFNKDGRIDLVVAQYTQSVAILLGVRPSTVTFAVSPSPGTLGQPVTLTATITPANATGTVTFSDGSTVLAVRNVVGGIATFTTSALSANRHFLYAVYSGDATTAPPPYQSQYEEIITGIANSVALTVSSNPAVYGHPVTLNATLTPAAATGVVNFYDGVQVLGSAVVSVGKAAFSTALLPAGKQPIRAIYAGDATYASGTASGIVPVQVNAVPANAFQPKPFSVPGALGSPPSGFAGDFNGDKIPDIAFLLDGTLSVQTGKGDGTFTNSWSTTVNSFNYYGESAEAIAVGDFNGDGKLDLVVPSQSGMTLFTGNGDGTFTQAGSLYGLAVLGVVAADFNQDGIPDLVSISSYGLVQMLLGNGDGTFLIWDSYSVPSYGGAFASNGIAVGDFNGDGKTDVAASLNGRVSVLLGNGDGSLQTAVALSLTADSGAVVSADFNGDGIPDLAVVVLNSGIAGLNILTGKGDGTFQPPVSYTAPGGTLQIGFGDFNGDGKPDLVTSNGAAIWLWYGNGDGTFQSAAYFPFSPPALVIADFNGDGRADLPGLLGGVAGSVTVSASSTTVEIGHPVSLTAAVSPLSATGAVTFFDGATAIGTVALSGATAAIEFTPQSSGVHSLAATYQGDVNYFGGTSAPVNVLATTVAGGAFSNAVNYFTGLGPSGVANGDFNHDGAIDLAVINGLANTITILWGKGDGTFENSTTFATGVQPVSLAVGDLNGDGIPDIVIANEGGSSITVLVSRGGTLTSLGDTFVPGSPYSIGIADFNSDGRADLIVDLNNSSQASLLFGNGDGTFTAANTTISAIASHQVAVGDFNGDRHEDAVIGAINLFLGNGQGGLTDSYYSGGGDDNLVIAGDFNGDGKLDLAFAQTTSYSLVYVALGNGDGTFGASTSYPIPSGATALATGDFNGDGKADLAVTNAAGTFGVMFGNGDGSFEAETLFLAGLSPQALTVGDFNGDGRLDVAVANSEGSNVSVLLGQPSACTFSISPTGPLAYDDNGGTVAVTITASGNTCEWSANVSESYNSNATQTQSGAGSGTFSLQIPPNYTGTASSGSINVANRTIAFTIAATAQVFTDVPPSAYYFDAVNLLKQKGITSGCSPTTYCPTADVTRAQMAIFIVTGIEGGSNFTYSPTPYFADVPSGAFGFQYIQKMFELGITSGCGGGNYCPNNTLTRAQMAIFIIKARYGPSAVFDYPSTPYFSDVPSSAFGFGWIQRMREDNITSGCGPGIYCPNNAVTRGDMAIFIMDGLFNRLLPASEPVIGSVGPTTVAASSQLSVSVFGVGTHFLQGITIVNPITGFTVGAVTVYSPTSLSVAVTAGSSVTPQPESVWVTTGTEEAVLPNVISVVAQ